MNYFQVLSKEFYKVLKDLKPHLNAQPGSFEHNIPLTEQHKETLASGLLTKDPSPFFTLIHLPIQT